MTIEEFCEVHVFPHVDLREWDCIDDDLDAVDIDGVIENFAAAWVEAALDALGIDDPNSDAAVAVEEALVAYYHRHLNAVDIDARLREEAYLRLHSEPYSLKSLGMRESDFL